MTTSSQTPPGALPPETPPSQRPMPLSEALAAAPQATAEQASSVTAVQAATGVIRAAMDRGSFTPRELAQAEDIAQAEEDAGLLFDPQRAEDIARAAIEQARAEYEAKLDELRDDEAGAYFKVRYDRLRRLLAGHPDSHLMSVGEILAAVDGRDPREGAPLVVEWDGLVMGPSGDTDTDAENTLVPCTTKLGGPAALVLTADKRAELARLLLADPHGVPLRLTWDRSAEIPEATDPVKRVTVNCVSPYGGRAALVVEGEDRLALASLLDAELVRDIHALCGTDGCGTVDDYDASDPALFGWARVEVAGIEGGPRWYCTPQCVSDALARAGEELAVIDDMAATDPDEQVPYLPAEDVIEDQAVPGER